jgi:inward rectifier potassium channel
LLTNATVRLGVLLPEVIAEGHSFRYVHDLALSNATLPLFALTWTMMHRIDENSPLAGRLLDKLIPRNLKALMDFISRMILSEKSATLLEIMP